MTSFCTIKHLPAYAVGDDGTIIRKFDGTKISVIKGRILDVRNGALATTAYLKVRIEGWRYTVHRLVAEAFIENPDNLPFVDHIDSNSLNNNVSNLRWVSCSTNSLHARKYRIIRRNLTSKYKGASKRKYNWACRFRGKGYYGFKTERAAAEHYNKLAFDYDSNSILNVFSD